VSLSWVLPLPVMAVPGSSLTLTAILRASFGTVPQTNGAWLYENSAQDLISWDFSYWNLNSKLLGTWYYNGSNIGTDSSRYVPTSSFDSAVFVAGNNIGPFADVYLGTTWYSMITVDPRLINLPANNQEPTPQNIVDEAYRFNSFYGWVANDNDCGYIDQDVAAAVGATQNQNVWSLDPTQNQEGGFWRIAYRGSQANPVANWQTLVRPGDMVRLGWTTGGPHTTLVLAVNADGTMVVYDNGDWVNGVEGIGIHTVKYDPYTIPTTITIYRLTTDGLYLQQGDDAGDTILGTIFNDHDIGGAGNDTITGGPGNDIIDGGSGFNIATYTGNLSQYQISQVGSSIQVTDLRSGSPDGLDELTNIQELQFADRYETAPTVTASDRTATRGQSFVASSLFSVSDAENDATTNYALWDAAGDTGYWLINGVAQSDGVEIDITAAQFAQTTFQSASGADHLWVRAYDGTLWGSWTGFYVTAPIDHAPAVAATVANYGATHNQNIAATILFSVSDADNDAITAYQLWDSTADSTSGHWVVGGLAQPAGQAINLTPSQLSSTTFQSGSNSDHLWVRAFDGVLWSDWKDFYVTPPVDNGPVVNLTMADFAATHHQNIAATSLFSASDAFGDPITRYQVWDSVGNPSGGYWIVGGVPQPVGQAIDVTPSQLASASFQSGSGTDHLWVRAGDATEWGAWQGFYVTAPIDSPPVVTVAAANYPASHNLNIAATSLFSVSDADGDTITAYQFWDTTDDPTSGHWVVGGVVQLAGQAINVTPAQLAGATFQSGSGSDDLWVRANDGIEWGAWTEFHVNAPIDNGPTVSVANLNANHGQSFAGSSLFSNYSDPFSSPATQYDFWDTGAGGGHFVLNGTMLGAGQDDVITAAQLAQLSYQSGSGADTLWVRANDGTVWGAWSNGFTVTAPIDTGPMLSVANLNASHGQSFAGSSLFNYNDPFGSAATQYALYDTGPGYFVLNGTPLPNNQTNIISAAQLPQLSYQSGSGADTLWVKANDGTVWGPWSGFTVTAPIDLGPVLTVGNLTATPGQSLAASSLFSSYTDPFGSAATQYDFYDTGAGGGHFSLNGTVQPTNQGNIITAAQLSQMTYVAGSGTDTLWVRANDGTVWGGWSNSFTVTA
jgi:hypothetical protein